MVLTGNILKFFDNDVNRQYLDHNYLSNYGSNYQH